MLSPGTLFCAVSIHGVGLLYGPSPLRISSKTLSIEPNLFLDWSSPLIEHLIIIIIIMGNASLDIIAHDCSDYALIPNLVLC